MKINCLRDAETYIQRKIYHLQKPKNFAKENRLEWLEKRVEGEENGLIQALNIIRRLRGMNNEMRYL